MTGNTTSPADGLTLTATGSYDSSTMSVTWSYRQHVESGGCATDVKGDGTFTASPP